MLHQTALNKAKIDLMSHPNSAFFTTVCFSLKHVWDDTTPTACTDGLSIKFNPQFFLNLNPQERVFLLIHESMHVALLHMARLNDRDHVKWNIAADHVINLMLIERGFEMPKMGLADPIYKDMSTDQVYAALPEDAEIPEGSMDLSAPPGDLEDFTAGVQDILIRAAIQSKINNDSPGCIPGEIRIYLDKLLKPRLPWQQILRRYVSNLSKNDYTFKKANRRFFPKHHLPSLYSENLMNIAIAVDASGSVTDNDFKVFISEVSGIFRMMKPDKITLLQFDVDIRSINTIKSAKELSALSFSGRGGTDITAIMEWAQEVKPQLLLVFSDGQFNFYPAHTIKTPILWVIHNNPEFTAPFGKTLHYTV